MVINVLGYGLMGRQIAALMFLGGYDVFLWNHKEVNEKDIIRQVKLLKRSLNTNMEGSITFCSSLDELPDAITFESVVEDIGIKRNLYEYFEKSSMPYFTNSSSFSPSEINKKVCGFHFFNPVSMKLVEMYLSKEVNVELFAPILNYLENLDFEIVSVNSNRGYIGNYILFNEISSALKLIEKFDYTYAQLDVVYNKMYDGRNLFTIIDIIGIDIVYKILVNLKEDDESIYLPACLSEAIEKNILGKKNKTSIKDVLS